MPGIPYRLVAALGVLGALSLADAAWAQDRPGSVTLPSQNTDASLPAEATFILTGSSDRMTYSYWYESGAYSMSSVNETTSDLIETGCVLTYRPAGRYRNAAVPFFFVPYNHYETRTTARASYGSGSRETSSLSMSDGVPIENGSTEDLGQVRMGLEATVDGEGEHLELAWNYLRIKPSGRSSTASHDFLLGVGLNGPRFRLGGAFAYGQVRSGSDEELNPNAVVRGAITPTPFWQIRAEHRRLIIEDYGPMDQRWTLGTSCFFRDQGVELGVDYDRVEDISGEATKTLGLEVGLYRGRAWWAASYFTRWNDETDIRAHGVTLAGRMRVGETWYLDGSFSLGWSDFDHSEPLLGVESEYRDRGLRLAATWMY